ncbi:MAG: Calx-beta domain-containing protein [Verrucomicrobiota bacterium]
MSTEQRRGLGGCIASGKEKVFSRVNVHTMVFPMNRENRLRPVFWMVLVLLSSLGQGKAATASWVKPSHHYLAYGTNTTIKLVAWVGATYGATVTDVSFYKASQLLGSGRPITQDDPESIFIYNYATTNLSNMYIYSVSNLPLGRVNFTCQVTDSYGAQVMSPNRTIDITSNAPPYVVSAFGVVTRASEDGDSGMVILWRDRVTDEPLVVYPYQWIGGNAAVSGVNFVPLPESVIIPAGSDRVQMPIIPLDDNAWEPIKYVAVNIAIPSNCPGVSACYGVDSQSSSSIRIYNNDPTVPPQSTVDLPTNNAWFNTNQIIAIRGRAWDEDDRVSAYRLMVNGTLGSTINNTNLLVSTANNIVTNEFQITWSNAVSGQYMIQVRVEDTRSGYGTSAPVYVNIGSYTNPPAIQNTNLPLVCIRAVDAFACKGTNRAIVTCGFVGTNWQYYIVNGTNTAAFMISRSEGDLAAELPVVLNISGTASNGVDYEWLTNQIVIPAEQNSVRITVRPMNDGVSAPTETVILQLQTNSSTSYRLGNPSLAVATIADNDQICRSSRLPEGYFNLQLSQTNFTDVRIEASDDLIKWTILGTNGPDVGVHHVDIDTLKKARRFYRVIRIN